MNNIILLEQTETDLQELSVWQHYTRNNIDSFVLVSEELEENEIIEIIESKIPYVINLDNLSPYLQQLINDCNQSENDMWFVESTDIFYNQQLITTRGAFEHDLQKEVEQNGLSDCIVFNENDCYITVYGGINEKINFNNCLVVQ